MDVPGVGRGRKSVGAPASWPGGGPRACVGLLLERSAQAIIAMLGVLKTGAAYLPIDPALPTARIEFMLADAGPIAVVTNAGSADRLDGCGRAVIDVEDPRIPAQPTMALPGPAPQDIAYLIYTSGTTGVPKGVAITHHNVTRMFDVAECGPARWWPGAGVVAVSLVCLSTARCGRSSGALLHGGRLVVVPDSVARSPEDLHALLVAEQVTVLIQTPSAAAVLSPDGLEVGGVGGGR